jgi:hypothetical protein
MRELTVAADEVAATELLHDAEAKLGTKNRSGSQALGPFDANWSATAFLTDGIVNLTPPDLIGLENCNLHYNLHFSISLDLNTILQPIVITFPGVDIDYDNKLLNIHIHIHYHPPPVYIYWPHVTIPVSHAGVARFAGNFKLNVYLSGGHWKIDAVSLNVTSLQLDNGAVALMAALSLAASAVLSPIPFIGPVLSTAVAAITVAIGIGGVTNFLTNILNQFLVGLTFPLYDQPRIFQVLPASSPINPEVKIKIDVLIASVQRTDEDELVIEAWIAPM